MGEEVFTNIRIYLEDKRLLEKEFSKDKNFAEIIHELTNLKRGIKC